MSSTRWSTPTALVICQLGLGAGAHTLAHGCPPSLDSLPVLLPLATGGIGGAHWLLRARSQSVRLAGGQAVVHLALAIAAACAPAASDAHVHAHDGVRPAALVAVVAMLLAHAVAVFLCMLLLARAPALLERLSAVAGAILSRLCSAPGTSVTPEGRQPAPLAAVPHLSGHAASVRSGRGPPVLA